MGTDELRTRCSDTIEEILGADTHEDAVDALVALCTRVQADQLTRADRVSLAAVMGYDLGVEEGALEVANIRRLLDRHGVREADGLGVARSTVAMVEELVLRGGARPTSV